MNRKTYLISLGLIAIACKADPNSVVIVSATADETVPAIHQLQIALMNEGQLDTKYFPEVKPEASLKFPTTFTLTLSPSRSNRLEITVVGLDSADVAVAKGTRSATIIPGGKLSLTVDLVKDGTGSTGVVGTGGVTGLGGAGGGGNSISAPSMDSGHDAVFVMGAGGVGGSESTQHPPVTVENLFDAAPIINTNLDGGEAKTCGVTKFELNRSLADVLIVMDISGSMEIIVEGTGRSRWVNEYSAILDIVKATEKDLNWGLKMFPDKDGTTCLVRPGADVEVGPNNFINIDSAITPLKPVKKPPGAGTPTGDAVFAGFNYLKNLKSTKPQYMILATDGEPNCPVQGASSTRSEADIAAVKYAHDQGVDTFVIGVNEELLTNRILTGMAIAGGRTRPVDPVLKTPFYVAEDKESLVKALKEITGKIASCHFSLGFAPPPSPDDVAVDVIKKGATKTPADRAPRDKTHTNGWDYISVDYKVIEFYGSWCTKVQNLGVEGNIVEFTFGCPGVAVP